MAALTNGRYTMEKMKPVGHELIVFGRSSYIFGKYRLKKSIRSTEIADKMLPSLSELGVETEGNSGQVRVCTALLHSLYTYPFLPVLCGEPQPRCSSTSNDPKRIVFADCLHFALRQFFYPPGGFRTWHTNVWDGLGWRGYIVHVDKDNMSALNVMLGDKLVRCPDKAAIFRCARAPTCSQLH